MRKFPCAAILLIFIIAVMLVLNTALLHLLYGIDPADQLDALTSLAVAGSFPGREAPVSGESRGQQAEGGRPAGTGSTNAMADMAASQNGEAAGANGQNKPAGELGPTGEPGVNGEPSANDEPGDGYFMTLEEIGLLKNMSLQDKLKAVSILSGVDRNVLDSAIEMAGDGITYNEYNELMDSADEYLDPTDIKTLEDILNRNISLYAQSGR
jgi:hypothetical protein